MSIGIKIIKDIVRAIKETLRVLQKHKPEMYSGLSTKPYSKKLELELYNMIYDLYHIDSKMAKYFTDIYMLEVKEQYKEKVKELNIVFKDRLHQALEIVRKYTNIYTAYTSWVEVNPGIKATRRMYLNCNPNYIHEVVRRLMKLMAVRKPKIMFKFPNYKMIQMRDLIRADKLVVYYGDDKNTHEVLRKWVERVGRFLHKSTPLFTRVEREGVGFAYEPSPEQQEYSKTHTREETSFGGFIALVIARYLYMWSVNYKRIPEGKEIVQIAEEIYKSKLKGKHKFKF